MRAAILAVIAALSVAVPASAQEDVGTSTSAQTTAPSIGLPQAPSCGAVPSVAQINRLLPVIRRMFPQPRGFDATYQAELRKPCHRNHVAAYLIHLIANNNWTFVPAPGVRPGLPASGSIACGFAATSADLNTVIGKLRPLFADPAAFNANIAAIGRQPCIGVRATLYLFAVMADNGLSLR